MTIYLGKSCSFGLPRVPFENCRQFMHLVISLLVLRAGCGIWLYQFLIIAYLFTLLSTAAEIKTLEGREMLAGLISPPVTDWLLHNTSRLARLDGITIVGQEYDLLGSVQFWSAWFEFTIGCFLEPSLGLNFEFELYHAGLCIFNKLYMLIV